MSNKRKLATSNTDEPAAKYARKGRKDDDDTLVKRTNALSIEAFRDVYVAEDQLIYVPRGPRETDPQYSTRNQDGSAQSDGQLRKYEGSPVASEYAPHPQHIFRIALKAARDLEPAELVQCHTLVEQTSRQDYEASSWSWHPKRKKREMLEPEMRYLLVRSTTTATATGDSVEGFLSFMITHDSDPPVPVLYVYEIHLAEPLRKVGLGAHLMQLAEDIAQRVGVRKVMLTCFLSNAKARRFYERRGYTRDVCSPDDRKTRKRVVEVDYVIMSKTVERAPPKGTR
ncbi:hypothetical protein B0A55_06907 [Friedmanniomyces simplex]|uniref:N-alpha-acetyltransferase 40 n=1 Tax=Friedmanniomyces simplex TaxID=329884 RepID=A0A4U0X6W3_9PEZI|nr:hypothetical protein B0A55_06907 [Friedmanniomyces simplex]